MVNELGADAAQAEIEPLEVIADNVDEDEDEEGDFAKFEGGGVYYLNPGRVTAINASLREIGESVVDNYFDAKKMNALGIYPRVWSEDENPRTQFNKPQLKEDLEKLRQLFSAASEHRDYVLVLIG